MLSGTERKGYNSTQPDKAFDISLASPGHEGLLLASPLVGMIIFARLNLNIFLRTITSVLATFVLVLAQGYLVTQSSCSHSVPTRKALANGRTRRTK